MSHDPSFSVIVPTCDRPADLAACLDCLAPGTQTTPVRDYEVIVTDDGAITAESWLTERFPWARWTRGPRRGPAANRNHGATLARGSWLAFTDDDCRPDANWLAAYARHAHAHFVLEGPTLATGTRTSLDSEAPLNPRGGLLWSCNFALTRKLFADVGGFDAAFDAATMEDVELATRLAQRGHTAAFVPEAVVLHPWRRSKGRAHLRAYARAVRRFVALHPEQVARFTFGASLRTFYVLGLRRCWEGWRAGLVRGSLRVVALEAYRFGAVRAALLADRS